ncbi:MAG: 5'-nucleotidase C-terminal domain-containing protein [Lachnospiraceae bacterium]|nr:5'-nucleotidase C-terminal domain-containing protein [Lachnospiraceae bacterium]
MRHKKVTRIFKRLLAASLLLFLTTSAASGAAFASADDAVPEEPRTVPSETIDFRVLATGDLHGQVTAFNYETGEEDKTVGLSKIATLVTKERTAAGGRSNTLLVDAGDTMYNYFANFIYEKYPDDIQPVYQAMSYMKYDCITLGNHDFDYPWEYLYGQLKSAGLLKKTLVSNAVYTESGEYPFAKSAIYTKNMTTSSGRTVPVKIGVVGATLQSLSSRRYRYSGFIDGLDVYESVKTEAAQLKAKGADVIVAVIHGGVGLLSGSNTSIQAGSRLIKLPEVDAVVCSHSHETFPSTDNTYQKITGVDEQAGTFYGKPMVETGSYAQGLGVIEFTLAVDKNDTVSIYNAASAVRPVKATTKEKAAIVGYAELYKQEILDTFDKTEYEMADGLVYTNVDCAVQDSSLYQLMNDAKLHFASSYIADYTPQYKDYPIIAATVNNLDNREEAIAISGTIKETDVSALLALSSSQRSSGYIHIYKLSATNLIEWLEYNASIYATAGTPLPENLASYAAKHPEVSALLNTENTAEWKSFFAFDGISYDIDLSVEPRYNAAGTLLRYTHRIQNLTYQGKPVTTDMTFLVTMDSVAKRYKFMPTDDNSIFLEAKNPFVNSHDLLMDYIRELAYYGPVRVTADDNWHLIVPEGYQFVVAMPKAYESYVKAQDWYEKRVRRESNYYYYQGNVPANVQDVHAVLSPDIIQETSRKIPVQVYASTAPDASITEILYLTGTVRNVKNTRWESGKPVSGNTFTISKNGKYSVRVTDSLGRMVITHITIDNFDSAMLEMPKVNTLTNRIETATGTAIPGSMIHVALPDGRIVTEKATEDGTFSVPVPLPRSYDLYTIWATKGNKTSLPVETTVKKTGANQPTADPLQELDTVITGRTDPYTTLSVRIGSTVYVGYGEKDAYTKSSVYKKSHKLVETEILISKNGNFRIVLPREAQQGETWMLYATDRNGNASRIVYIEAEPKDPAAAALTNILIDLSHVPLTAD